MIRKLSDSNFGHYDTAFFDLDGTIVESGDGVANAVKYMFSRLGAPVPEKKALYKFVGPPVKHHLIHVYNMDTQQAEQAYALFREYYLDRGIHECQLYEGIEHVLLGSRRPGRKLFIATCKTGPMARMLLERYGLINIFDDVFGAHHEQGIYNKTQVLQNALERLGGLPENAVMIGDRSDDVAGGKATGLHTAAVLYGYGDIDELSEAGCDYLLDSVADIKTLLGGEI